MMHELLGLSLKSEQLSWWQMCDRAFVIYICLIVIMRVGKKRSLGRATAFDAILMIIIGSIAARTITGGAPFVPGLAAVALLVALHWVLSFIALRSPTVSTMVKGTATRIVVDGSVDQKAMAAAHMSNDDLAEDLRSKGVDRVDDVRKAMLERSGKLSVVKK